MTEASTPERRDAEFAREVEENHGGVEHCDCDGVRLRGRSDVEEASLVLYLSGPQARGISGEMHTIDGGFGA
jgi:hypothetical protein